MESIKDVWGAVCDYCKSQVNEVTYETWFTAMSLQEISGKSVVIFVKSDFQKKIIIENYIGILKDAFAQVLRFEVELRFVTESDKPIGGGPIKFSENASQYEYTFDTFIVGGSNRFAHAASLAVCENQAAAYNPLFIWGTPGVGKTHLLSAIASRARELSADKKIVSVSCESFVNEFIYCLQHGSMQKFREKYRTVDFLLIDDIQFIAGKESTEEEFFNTFNYLYENHSQIVVTSDRPPKDIRLLPDRLKSRFEAGLIADIQPPEYETRIGIFKSKAKLMDFELPEEIVSYVCDHIKGNIRQIEGVVKKLHANSMVYDEITFAVAEGAIRDIKKDDLPEPITVQRVVSEVSRVYNVSVDDIFSKKQDAIVSQARQIAMYVIRQTTEMSYKLIGEEFGGRNHATVLYACNNIQKLCEKNTREQQRIEDIMKNVLAKN